jgi:type IV pilus assembly protein PilB
MSEFIKDKIIKALVGSKKISQSDIEEAMLLQKKKGISLDKILIQKGLIDEKDLLMILVHELNIPFINLSKYKVDPSLKSRISEKIARQYNIIPISSLEDTVTIAMADPLNIFVIDDLKNITGCQIDVVMSTSSDIIRAIDAFYKVQGSDGLTDLSKEIEVDKLEIISEQEMMENVDESVDQSEQAPIIRMVNLVVKEAIKQRASDIHMEPMADCVRVRYRIDGVLKDILQIPKENQNAVVTRIKIMSHLDITMNHLPQDGRFKLRFPEREVDFRVSLLPTTFGQKIVLRVLDKKNLSVGIKGLGLSETALSKMTDSISQPFGMILITGPTGSGKSTTLYSILNELNTIDKNIITVEDPVEYLVEGMTQIQARPEIGLTFAEGLKAMLRQSPDIVMVGEIRDGETADIAIKASLTGQLVLSTLHTNDAAGALTRLVDMGVEPFLVASSLVVVTAQRLCRKICQQCKEEVQIADDVLKRLKIKLKPGTKIYQGKGCDKCRQTGYMGRMCITEILQIDDMVRNLLLEGKSSDSIKEYACKEQGMATLWDDALEKWGSGLITLEEVLRVATRE